MKRSVSLIRMAAVALSIMMPVACASGARSDFGLSAREQAVVVGFPDVRFAIEDAASAEILRAGLEGGVPRGADAHFDVIALSGGGANGAFTTGLITGWTERGDRPDFEVVTGVSTGALAAPFVFLGPEYDDRLREAFLGGQARNLLQGRGLQAFFGSGLFKADPLRDLIAHYVDAPLLEAIAAEHRKGRVLLVATTNLDLERGMLWNMGEIAAIGGPDALKLFRDVLQASASIPGAFPPVMITAQVRDPTDPSQKPFEEMHVDGGVLNPFVALPQLLWTWTDDGQILNQGRIWVVVNGKAAPVMRVTSDSAPEVVSRALNASLSANLRANLTANRVFAERNGLEFRVAAIPAAFAGGDSLDFSPEAMQATYDLGRTLMAQDKAWSKGWEEDASALLSEPN